MEEQYKGYTIKIEQDQIFESPREWDNLSTMVLFHNKYSLGDKDHGIDSDNYSGWSGMKEAIIRKFKPVCIAPVYLYDHSGISIKIGSFSGLLPEGHAEFDSGQIGFVFISAEKARENWSAKRISKKIRYHSERVLNAEINIYDQFLRGDVYGYSIEELNDSCWGFYGYDCCLQEAKSIVDWHIEKQKKDHLAKLKVWIQKQVPFQYRKPMPGVLV